MSGTKPPALYRLKIIDLTGMAYVVIGSKNDIGWVLDWLTDNLTETWLKVSAFDDDADRAPITIMIARESIAGLLFARL